MRPYRPPRRKVDQVRDQRVARENGRCGAPPLDRRNDDETSSLQKGRPRQSRGWRKVDQVKRSWDRIVQRSRQRKSPNRLGRATSQLPQKWGGAHVHPEGPASALPAVQGAPGRQDSAPLLKTICVRGRLSVGLCSWSSNSWSRAQSCSERYGRTLSQYRRNSGLMTRLRLIRDFSSRRFARGSANSASAGAYATH